MASIGSILKTAEDAERAKQSTIAAGFEVGNSLYRELLRGKETTTSHPQTALVNAGYAVRIHCVLEIIRTFVEYHNHLNDAVNLIILGAGLDITGLWALLRFPSCNVIEVDFPEICETKRTRFQHSDALKERNSSGYFYQGLTTNNNTITLLAGDLHDVSIWFGKVKSLIESRRCLVLSELVLSYLQPQGCENVLESISHLKSAAVCLYEPSLASDDSSTRRTTLGEFKASYRHRFREKLDRGVTRKTALHKEESNDRWSHWQNDSVYRRARNFFPHLHWTNAGRAAVSLGLTSLSCPQLFDESAALTLHLQSYVVACAFTADTDVLLRDCLCPWATTFAPIPLPGASSGTWITTMSVSDESEFRSLFEHAYASLSATHPSIRKMVSTALRKDLALSIPSEGQASTSRIRGCYLDQGGDFLVVVQQQQQPADNSASRFLLGGIALRACTEREKEKLGRKSHEAVFEIHRLLVRDTNRSRGIGQALLAAAVKRVLKGKTGSLLATTPSLASAATRFYTAAGFSVVQEVTKNGLTLYTYAKEYE